MTTTNNISPKMSKQGYIKALKRLQKSLNIPDNLSLTDYQNWANKTALFDSETITGLYYVTLGLVGEAGEVAEKVKKILRNQKGKITPENKADLLLELGDVLWYMSQFARILGFTLSDVGLLNILKLQDRAKRGKIKSQGDIR